MRELNPHLISPASPLYLPYISPTPHLYLQVSELNPHLGEALHEVFQLLAATLLRINRLAYVAPCLLQVSAG